MRARLRAVGLEDTAAALVTDREMLHAFAAKHGLPLVVKPNGGVASVGVSVARTPADLDACFATAVAEHGAFSSPGVLAERFFEGPQFSIEGRSSTRSGCEESGPDPDVTVAAHAQPGARLDGLRDNYSRLAEARAFAPDPEQALAMARDAIGKLRIVVHAPPADPDCF